MAPFAWADAPSLPARSIKFSVPKVSLAADESLVFVSTVIRKLNGGYIECERELFKLKFVLATCLFAFPNASKE